MKVLLLFLGDIDESPYFNNYMRENVIYHSISIDKFSNSEKYSNIHEKYYLDNSYKINKIFNYKRIFKKIIKLNNYDLIIILNSQLSVLLNKELLKFKGKIILDIRDYILENNCIYSYLQNKVIYKSDMTVISSKGYKNFLPKHDYFICHNIPQNNPTHTFISDEKPDFKYLNIGQIGFIRFININNELVEYFKKDKYINLFYIGNGSENIIDDKRVFKIGYFKPEETYHWYREVNVINNLYGNNDENVKYALSNKLYLSALLYKPIIVSPNTEMSKVVNEYGLGFTFDIKQANKVNNIRKLRNNLQDLDWNEYKRKCDNFIFKVRQENNQFMEKLDLILKDD